MNENSNCVQILTFVFDRQTPGYFHSHLHDLDLLRVTTYGSLTLLIQSTPAWLPATWGEQARGSDLSSYLQFLSILFLGMCRICRSGQHTAECGVFNKPQKMKAISSLVICFFLTYSDLTNSLSSLSTHLLLFALYLYENMPNP